MTPAARSARSAPHLRFAVVAFARRVLNVAATAMDQPRTDEDQALVARAQSGEAAAFDELVVKYSPRLYGLIYNMTSNHEDTNDMLQDVFAKAYRAIKGFRGKSSFYTWIHTIAVNMTLNFLKKRGRRYHLSLDDVDGSSRERQGIYRAHFHEQSGARSRPLRAPAKIERGHDEAV